MKYNSIGEQLIAKAKELDPNYKPDKFNDMSEALNIILNNIEINGSNFQIIDLTSDGSTNSISSVYNLLIDSEAPIFSNQSAVYNNIATAVNNGLVPILKFTDGYGYYKEYLSSSSEYVFTLNHITKPEQAGRFTYNVIFLKVSNRYNLGDCDNLSQIPSTVVISSGAFGKSGTLSIEETNNFNKVLNDIDKNLSAGIFILNNVDKKIYYVSTLLTSSFEIIAYTINKYGVEVLAFAKSGQQEDRLVYTKTTYALSGSSGNMVNLGTLSNSGTLEAEILQELLNLFGNFQIIQALFIYNNNIYITANAYSNGSSMGIVAYDVSNSLNVVNLSINTTNASYTITPIEIPASFKTINGQSILGSGDLPITADITYATDGEVNNLFTNPGQAIPNKTISLENLNAFKQQINNEINNEIGQVLEEGF